MARMDGAQWVGPHHDNGVMSRYDVACVHTIVGQPPAHAAHFSTRADGLIYQSRDTAYRSKANADGNHRVIAIENDDWGPEFGNWDGDPRRVPAFTDAQIEAIAKICVWAYRTHGIPLVLCPDSRPTSRGIAYHRQGIDSANNFAGYAYGGRQPGGEVWSASKGKACPGDRRIYQLVNRIIPRARQLAGLEPGGSFMAALSDQEQRTLYDRVMGILPQRYFVPSPDDPSKVIEVSPKTTGAQAATVLDTLAGNYLVSLINDVIEEVDALKAALVAPVPAEIDYDRIIDGVVAKISDIRFEPKREV